MPVSKCFAIILLCLGKYIFCQENIEPTIIKNGNELISGTIVYYLDGDSSIHHTETVFITNSFGFSLTNGKGFVVEFTVNIGDDVSISANEIDKIVKKDGRIINGSTLRTYSKIGTSIPYLILGVIVINNYFVH